MNKYRVDRNDSQVSTPLGMTSIVVITDSRKQAESVYANTKPGFNGWNQPDPRYGVTLAMWDNSKNDYVILHCKGF